MFVSSEEDEADDDEDAEDDEEECWDRDVQADAQRSVDAYPDT